jgi:hypothetical protein
MGPPTGFLFITHLFLFHFWVLGRGGLFGTIPLQPFKQPAALSCAVFTHVALSEAPSARQTEVSLYFVKTQFDVQDASCAIAIGADQEISRPAAKNILA